MNRRILTIVAVIVALLLALGVGAAAGGGVVYALTQGDGPAEIIRALTQNNGFTPIVRAASTDSEPGIVIASVEPRGPADEAGVVRGDILLEIDGKAVDTPNDLVSVLEDREPGDEVRLTVLHGDDERTLTATLGGQEAQAFLGISPCGAWGWERILTAHVDEDAFGALIVAVEPESPADRAGLATGDVVVAVDGVELDADNTLAGSIAAYEPGDSVTLEVTQHGEESREVQVKLDEHPEKEGVAYLGVEYRPLPTFRMLEDEALPRGWPRMPFRHISPGVEIEQGAVVRSVEEDSPAAEAGLQEGDIITAIEGEPVERPQDLIDAIAGHEPGDRITLTVFRPNEENGEEELEVAARLAEHPDEEGKAYLGVRIGGFFHVIGIEGKEGFDEAHPFRFHFDWEAPFDDLPFDPEELPRRFEFRFRPRLFEDG